jgi:hypothetical protein
VEPKVANPLMMEPEETRRGSISDEETCSKKYIEDLDQIGSIFDQNLFEKIN